LTLPLLKGDSCFYCAHFFGVHSPSRLPLASIPQQKQGVCHDPVIPIPPGGTWDYGSILFRAVSRQPLPWAYSPWPVCPNPLPFSAQSLIRAFGHPGHIRATRSKLLSPDPYLNLSIHPPAEVGGFLAEVFVIGCLNILGMMGHVAPEGHRCHESLDGTGSYKILTIRQRK